MKKKQVQREKKEGRGGEVRSKSSNHSQKIKDIF